MMSLSSAKLIAAVMLLSAAVLMSGCGGRARYVLITDRNDVDFDDGSTRFICLQAGEAAKMPGLLGLYQDSDIEKYGKTRKQGGDPLEGVLFPLVRKDYGTANARLHQDWMALPEGLRLLLHADMEYETGKDIPAERLTALYQDAYERQACDLNRDLIKLRIRQLRYGR